MTEQTTTVVSLEEKGMRVALLTSIANIILAVIKIVSGFAGNSYALIADGIE